jgi:hypothetical protein
VEALKMQNKQENFSMQDALRLANSPAGKELLSILQSQNNENLQKAKSQAEKGDYGQVQQTLSGLLQDPKVRRLLEEMRNGNG